MPGLFQYWQKTRDTPTQNIQGNPLRCYIDKLRYVHNLHMLQILYKLTQWSPTIVGQGGEDHWGRTTISWSSLVPIVSALIFKEQPVTKDNDINNACKGH